MDAPDHTIAYSTSHQAWEFLKTPTATRASEVPEELLDITETALSELSELFHPTELAVAVLGFDADYSLYEQFTVDPTSQTYMQRSDDEGVDWPPVRAAVEAELTALDHPYVRLMNMPDGRAKIQFPDETVWLDRRSERYRHYADDGTRKTPTFDPFSLQCSHVRRRKTGETDYLIQLWTYADLWFTESEVGRTNAARLSDALSGLRTALEPVTVDVYTEGMNEERLEAFL
jgi:hypothetical protein